MKVVCVSAMIIAAVISMISCDKDDNNSSVPTTLSRIQTKWSVTSKVMDNPGALPDSTYTGVSGDYVDFRTDSKVYSLLGTVKDTFAYKLLTDSTLVMDGDTAKISKLSSGEFVITQPTDTTILGVSYTIYNLKNKD